LKHIACAALSIPVQKKNDKTIQTLTIYDIMGRVIITTTFNSKNVTLPIAMLSSGIYILKINNTLTRKIEVVK
jgi:hypothetical protein